MRKHVFPLIPATLAADSNWGHQWGCAPRYVGKCEGLPLGWWIGVHFDEPVGRNDGSVKGKAYFQCPPGYGSFLRPDKVTVGAFPPIDDDVCFSSEDEI